MNDEKDEAGFTMDGALIKHDLVTGPARCGRSKAVPARRLRPGEPDVG